MAAKSASIIGRARATRLRLVFICLLTLFYLVASKKMNLYLCRQLLSPADVDFASLVAAASIDLTFTSSVFMSGSRTADSTVHHQLY